ncbi:FAD-dependent oxidoreductase [Aliihoeflea aestuarii]|uniref:NAD(P)/FAD-dependent oxidoreductase n=1 Tax=Aliihoeflea aestuarii TaxID=453840 RepID=UPI002091FD3D|nr:FAD-dependent oxidoreductase [Aliihoeflea aestuarii]MCO6391338.1 FAD-dependent oxidoreductase [Aliihoeflea aestuarii]
MDQPSAKSPIAIIGAGIIGVSTAIWLQRAGHDVILVDRAGPGEGTSYGNGGVLASAAIIPVTVPGLLGKAPRMLLSRNEPLFLNWSYLPRLAPWLRRFLSHATVDETKRIAAALHGIIGDSLADHQALASGTEAEKLLVPSDYLFLYRDRAAFAADAFGWDIRRAHGFEWDEFEGQALRDYDPAFSPQIGFAVRLPRHGRIADPGRYVKDLAAHAQTQGAHILKAAVDDFVIEDGRVTGLRAAGETIRCSGVVLAAGIWSKELARKLGVNVPLESERGYHVELWEPSVMPRSPVMISSAKFVVTPMEGRLRLAGIVEFGGLDAPPSRAPFDLLMRNIRAAMPGLTWTETREWMGHRPTATDSIPLIGPSPKIAGAWLGFGHHHVGLTGGPKTGRLLAQMISGATPNIDMTPYEPARFV